MKLEIVGPFQENLVKRPLLRWEKSIRPIRSGLERLYFSMCIHLRPLTHSHFSFEVRETQLSYTHFIPASQSIPHFPFPIYFPCKIPRITIMEYEITLFYQLFFAMSGWAAYYVTVTTTKPHFYYIFYFCCVCIYTYMSCIAHCMCTKYMYV